MTDPKPRFIWYELMTTNQDAAEKFYRAVVGWKTADAGQPDLRYTILSAGDRGMGGVMELSVEACKAGARPGWFGYVGVPDTDDAAKRIVEAMKQAAKEGKGAVSLDGRLIDIASIRQAEALLNKAAAMGM